MARESAGAVYVTIDGDASPLIAKYAQAEAASRAAGQRIASGLGQGLSSSKQIVDAYGVAFTNGITKPAQQAVPAVNEIVAAIQKLTVTMQEESAAASLAEQRNMALAKSLREAGQSAHGSVSEIQATSGALRTLEGNGGLRAAERFIASTLGLGGALQAIFPIVGAIAFGEILLKGIEKINLTTKAEKEAAEAAKQWDSEIKQVAADIKSIQDKSFENVMGKTAGKIREAAEMSQQLRANDLLVLDGKRKIAEITEKMAAFGANPDVAPDVESTSLLELYKNLMVQLKTARTDLNAAELAGADLKLKQGKLSQESAVSGEADNKKDLAETKAALEVQRQLFREFYDNKLADMKAAHEVTRAEELKFREQELADAKSRGIGFAPVATEVNRQVGTLSQEVRKEDIAGSTALGMAQVEYASRLRKEAISELEADGRLMGAAVEKITKEQDAAAAARKSAADIADRAGKQARQYLDVAASGSGEADKLRLQIAYEAQVVHTKQQQIDYAVKLGEIESATAQEKLRAADADVSDAQAALALNPNAVQLLQLQQAITAQKKAQTDLDNQGLRNQVRMQPLQRGLGSRLGDDAKQIGPAVSGALATGIMNGGKGLGQDIKQALSGIGRKMLDDVFTKLIEQLGINAAIDAITNSIGATHISAQAAQTAATVANTAALVASTTTQGASAAAGAGGAVAAAAGTAATGAVSSIIGPVIGGVISGVISAAATFIGDAAIVKAIHGTTAAVMSLRVSGVGQTSKGTNQQAGAQVEAPSTGLLSSIGAGLFQAITGAGALPVRIVAISPLAPLAGLFGLLGFAGGGRPPVGVPSIVGERGPELFIPDSPGVIIPNVPGTGGGTSSQMLTASMVSNSSSNAMSIGAIHLHGVQNVEQFARRLPAVLKSRAPVFSPATR